MTHPDSGADLAGPTDRVEPALGLAWGTGRFSATAIVAVFGLLVLYYLVDIVSLGPTFAGGLVFSARMVDVVVSPTVGMLSDRLRSRWGRRRPFFIAGGVLGAAASLMMFNVPRFHTTLLTAAFVETALVLYTLAYATINIPHMAIVNEMTGTTKQRLSLMSYGVIFTTLGGLGAGAVCPFLIQSFGDGQRGYTAMSLFLAAAILLCMLICFFGLARAPFVRKSEAGVSIVASLRAFGRNRPAVILIVARTINMVLVAGQTSAMIFFLRAIVKLPVSALGVATVCSTFGQFIAVPGWLWLARRFGNRRILLLANLMGGLIAASWLLARAGESLAVFSLRYSAFGVMASGSIMLWLAMITDVVEYDHLVSGHRREGLYNALFSFAEKTSAAIGVLATGMLLSAGGFDNRLGAIQDQPAHAVAALYVAVGVMPVVGFALCFLLLARFYRLNPGQLEAEAARNQAVKRSAAV
jgi:GPH family glycoside/pentoside/hexuronide:cation symporter